MTVTFLNVNNPRDKTNSNDDSLIVKIEYAEGTCILTRDATRKLSS